MTVKPIPDGFNTVSPYLVVRDAAGLIDFTKTVFDAQEVDRVAGPDGTVQHAEVRIGDSMVMMGAARDEVIPAMLYVYVADVDATYRTALQAGATSIQEPTDAFYGDRNAAVKDANGNQWWIATHVEDVPPEELARRAQEAHGG